MDTTNDLEPILETVRRLCAAFPGEYWRERDRERTYPTAFVQALTEAGLLGVLIPEEYGGSGLGLSAACAILEISSTRTRGSSCVSGSARTSKA